MKRIYFVIFILIGIFFLNLRTKTSALVCNGSTSYSLASCAIYLDTDGMEHYKCSSSPRVSICQPYGGFCESHFNPGDCSFDSNGKCTWVSSSSNIEPCADGCEPVNGWWTNWSACISCLQYRECTNPAPSCNGLNCPGLPTRACGTVDGGWSDWGSCNNCRRTRSCTNPAPACGGDACVGTNTLSCGDVNGTNTMCTGDRLCVNGIAASNVRNDGVNYIWDCIGTPGTCNGADGSSQTGCTYAIAQDSWFQTINGGIAAKSLIRNYVSQSCSLTPTTCTSAMSIRGFVSAPTIENNSNILYSSPNNWYANTNIVNKINYFEKYKKISGVGTTLIEGDLNDSGVINNTDGLLMVNGNVTISQNKEKLDLDDNYFFMIVASGDITIDPSVSKFDGMLVGNNINIGGTSIEPLNIRGSLYGTNNVNITRSFTDKMDNNDSPAVVVSFRPSYIFNMPSSMTISVVEWRWGN